MRKIMIAIGVLILTCSCRSVDFKRTVTIQLPSFSWEAYGHKVWSLVTYNGEDQSIQTMHLTAEEKTVKLEIPTGQMVCVVIRPLGFASPYGCLISPLDTADCFYPSQQEGYLASLFINMDYRCRSCINNHQLKVLLKDVMDYRLLDTVSLKKGILFGDLDSSSVKILSPKPIASFVAPNGIWLSDMESEGFFVVEDNQTPGLMLTPGIHFFWNPERALVLKILVQTDGESFNFMEASPLF